MALSHRWSLSVGIVAVLLCGALAAGASMVRSRDHGADTPTRCAAVPASPATDVQNARGISKSAPAGTRQTTLECLVQPVLSQPRLRAGVFGMDLASGAFFDIRGDESFAAASLIKIPIATALLEQVDRGLVSLGEILEMRSDQIAAGSGRIQYLHPGTRFTIGRLAELMIRKSDNTATNMLIDRLGGHDRLNGVFAAWGLTRTVLQTPLPDMDGTNRTSPRDLVTVIRKVVSENFLAAPSKSLLLSWMTRTHVRSLLPAGVGPGSMVANKTGDIPGAIGDAGYVEASNGRRYLLAVQVERPHNSSRAKELIRRVSRTVFESITGLPSSPGLAPGSARASRRRTRSGSAFRSS